VRFPKLTRTLIANAKGKPVEIVWPEGEPAVDKVYWVQSAEEKPKEPEETHAEFMAAMLGRPRPKVKRRRVSRFRRPQKGDPRVEVLSCRRLSWADSRGRVIHLWLAIVERYEEPAPVHYLQTKAYVPAGPDPFTGAPQKPETEPEQILESEIEYHHRRMEEQEAVRIAHAASVDHAALIRAQDHLRRQKRPSPLAQAAAQRAWKRAALKDDRSDCQDAA
jgi:hypothetical protein